MTQTVFSIRRENGGNTEGMQRQCRGNTEDLLPEKVLIYLKISR